jgi:transcriptional regulator with XRE-family HTH domain
MSIGDRIRAIRSEAGVTQDAFAKSCGVSSRALKAYELDERDPPSSFVLQLYKEFAANPTWLLTGDGAKSNEQFRQFVAAAIVAVRTFADIKKISFTPEKEAKLALLIADLYMGGGEPGGTVEQGILETAS